MAFLPQRVEFYRSIIYSTFMMQTFQQVSEAQVVGWEVIKALFGGI